MVRRLNPIDVDLYLVSESHLKIDSNYPYGDNIDEALDDLDSTLGGIGIILTGAGAITDPIPALLGKAGVPGFDDITTKPAEAAANALRRLRERMEKYRKTGVWSLSVPRQHYQFFCQVTEECRDGQWVETRREFIGQRIGPPTWDTSPSYEVQNVDYDSRRAWVEMTAKYARLNAAAERQIADAMSGCAG